MYLKSSENKFFELDFSISRKTCFYCETFSIRTVMQYFFEILAPLHISKHF